MILSELDIHACTQQHPFSLSDTSLLCSALQAFIRGAYYGTTYRAIEDTQSNDKICLIDMDTQGVQNVKASDLACQYMFISPPSIEELGECLPLACSLSLILRFQ